MACFLFAIFIYINCAILIHSHYSASTEQEWAREIKNIKSPEIVTGDRSDTN